MYWIYVAQNQGHWRYMLKGNEFYFINNDGNSLSNSATVDISRKVL